MVSITVVTLYVWCTVNSLHYRFAHRELPGFVLEADPDAVEEFFFTAGATKTLRGFWDKTSHEFPKSQRSSRDGLNVREIESDALGRCALVTFPSPPETSHSHFALVTFEPVRYFTLERARNFTTGQAVTMLCEWESTRAGLRHLNHGEGPDVEAEAFVEAVEEFVEGD